MLTRLSISNYALISSLDITFPDGLIIITGETGAGKSILLGALSLILGKRADSSVFSDTSRNCVVEAEFHDRRTGEEYILRRVITPAGRSRSFLNDEPVSLTDLAAISSRIIDIHEQHQHLLLTDPDFRLGVIDHFAGTAPLLEEYRRVYGEYESKDSEIRSLEDSIAEAERDSEYRQFQLGRLSAAGSSRHIRPSILRNFRWLSSSRMLPPAFQSILPTTPVCSLWLTAWTPAG